VMPSRETEIRSRGTLNSRSRRDLARGGVQPLARRNPARRGAQPSSEAEFYQCSIATLERSGVPPEGVQAACLVGRGPVSLSYARC
jgi:hypothetical protein